MSVALQHADLFLPPGGLWFGAAPARVRTLLGSCVAMTVWYPERRLGGMCHFMLPGHGSGAAGIAPDGRYGGAAMAWLLRRMLAVHGDRAAWHVKLFGGGAMFPPHEGSKAAPWMQVHRRNVEYACRFVSLHRLTVTAQDLGGLGHRSLVFELASGDVWVRHTRLTSDPPMSLEREAA